MKFRKRKKHINKSKYSISTKKKLDTKYIVMVSVVVVAILIIITVSTLEDRRNLTLLEKVVKDSSTYVVNIVSTPFNYIKEQGQIYKEKNEIYKKYKKVLAESEKSERYYAEILELKEEIKKLKESLIIENILSDYEPVNASISSRNLDYWYNTITIDKGSKDGIKYDMAVVDNSGLIGKTIKVSKFSSVVKLLSTEELSEKISVKIKSEDNDIYALLSGYDRKTNTYTLEGISDNNKIEKDSLVTTTGLSQIFPSGILVGKVLSVTKDEYDLTKIVKVTPSVSFNNINVVTVLKRGVKE